MENNSPEQKFILAFGTIVAEIDSRSLSESLSSFTTSVEEINKTLHTGKEISVVVKPFAPGSFDVPIQLFEFAIAGFLSAPHISSIPQIIQILSEFVDIKIRLKGRKPKSVEPSDNHVKIQTEDGDVYKIDQVTGDLVINNITINGSFNRSMNRLAKDGKVDKFELQDVKKNILISVKKDEFDYFTPASQVTENGERIREVRAILSIRKVVFDTTSKWGFYYEGVKISAKIIDKTFQKLAQTEGRFGNGDTFDAYMRIYQVYDETANAFVNKEYEILEVIEHRPRPKQMEMY